MSGAAVGESSLRLERLIASPPEVLFELWTEPALLAKWWAPEGYQAIVHTLDVSPGGHWRTSLRASDGREVGMRGLYRIVEPPRAKTELERRFLEPIAERLFAGYPPLHYAAAIHKGQVPANIAIDEFFFEAGQCFTRLLTCVLLGLYLNPTKAKASAN